MLKEGPYKYRQVMRNLDVLNVRGHALKTLLKVVKVFMNRNPKMPIPALRRNMERVLHLYSLSVPKPKYPIKIEHMYAEWVLDKQCTYDKAILYFHGGGYALGSCNTHRSLVNRIVQKSKVKALLVEYALAPESPFPSGLNDALLAYEWLIAQGYQAKDIILMGDSAGGGLALSSFHGVKARGLPTPGGCVCLSPWTDLNCNRKSFEANQKTDMIVNHSIASRLANNYVGDQGYDFSHPQISPIFGDFANCPPILIQASSSEVLYDDSKDLVKLLKDQELQVTFQVWKDMPHVWQIFSDIIPEGREAIENIAQFVRHTLGLEIFEQKSENLVKESRSFQTEFSNF
ncbi:MAG: alpha/beta hydrolase [Oligoflexales bacterium]